MKAYLIDPWLKTVLPITLPDGEGELIDAVKPLLWHTEPRCVEVVSLGGGVQMVLDDEGMLIPWDEQRFFSLGPRERARDFAGRAVVFGVGHGGESCDCPLPIEVLQHDVRWPDARELSIPAPTMTAIGDNGTVDVTHLDGVSHWTFDCQPSRTRTAG